MQLTLEQSHKNAIQAYSEKQLKINNTLYTTSLILDYERIIENWSVFSIEDLTEELLTPIFQLQPDIVILGNEQLSLVPMSIMQLFGTRRIGLECMGIGAAARTFNVLLNENRNVVAGFIFSSPCKRESSS
jgi:uncharacterized protein